MPVDLLQPACDDIATEGAVYNDFKNAAQIMQPGNKTMVIMLRSDKLVLNKWIVWIYIAVIWVVTVVYSFCYDVSVHPGVILLDASVRSKRILYEPQSCAGHHHHSLGAQRRERLDLSSSS